jgi:hypothetical protein
MHAPPGGFRIFATLGDDQRDVILPFMSPEPPNILDQRRNQRLGRHSTVPSQHFNQPLLTELLSRAVERFGHAVGIEHQQISREQLPLLQQAIPE